MRCMRGRLQRTNHGQTGVLPHQRPRMMFRLAPVFPPVFVIENVPVPPAILSHADRNFYKTRAERTAGYSFANTGGAILVNGCASKPFLVSSLCSHQDGAAVVRTEVVS